jgi:hypothetical protein
MTRNRAPRLACPLAPDEDVLGVRAISSGCDDAAEFHFRAQSSGDRFRQMHSFVCKRWLVASITALYSQNGKSGHSPAATPKEARTEAVRRFGDGLPKRLARRQPLSLHRRVWRGISRWGRAMEAPAASLRYGGILVTQKRPTRPGPRANATIDADKFRIGDHPRQVSFPDQYHSHFRNDLPATHRHGVSNAHRPAAGSVHSGTGGVTGDWRVAPTA